MNILIEKAGIDDLKELMDWRMRVLKAVFGIESKEEYQVLFRENEKYYKKSIPTGEHIAVFASLDGRKVGCGGICFYREMPSPDNPSGTCAYLMNIYTLDEYRNKGIARDIVKWLVKQAVDMGTGKIYLETTEKARKLYKSLGFVELKDYMILEERDERDN